MNAPVKNASYTDSSSSGLLRDGWTNVSRKMDELPWMVHRSVMIDEPKNYLFPVPIVTTEDEILMVENYYSPDNEVLNFLQKHPKLGVILVEVAEHVRDFFAEAMDLKVVVFDNPETGGQSLIGVMHPAGEYRLENVQAEMKKFEDWFIALFVQSDGLVTFHLAV